MSNRLEGPQFNMAELFCILVLIVGREEIIQKEVFPGV